MVVQRRCMGLLAGLTSAVVIFIAATGSSAAASASRLADPPVGPHSQDEARHVHTAPRLPIARTRPHALSTQAGTALHPASVVAAAVPSVQREVLGFAPYWELGLESGWRYDL